MLDTCRHGSTLLGRQALRQKLLLSRQKLLLLLCHNLDRHLMKIHFTFFSSTFSLDIKVFSAWPRHLCQQQVFFQCQTWVWRSHQCSIGLVSRWKKEKSATYEISSIFAPMHVLIENRNLLIVVPSSRDEHSVFFNHQGWGLQHKSSYSIIKVARYPTLKGKW